MAGSSTTVTKERFEDSKGNTIAVKVAIAFVADASDGSIPDTVISDDYEISAWQAIKGLRLDSAVVVGNHGGTEPQNDSDVYVYMASGGVAKAVDLLLGAGVDALDNNANNTVYPLVNSNKAPSPPVVDDLTITITQAAAAVNSATGTITLIFKE